LLPIDKVGQRLGHAAEFIDRIAEIVGAEHRFDLRRRKLGDAGGEIVGHACCHFERLGVVAERVDIQEAGENLVNGVIGTDA